MSLTVMTVGVAQTVVYTSTTMTVVPFVKAGAVGMLITVDEVGMDMDIDMLDILAVFVWYWVVGLWFV